MSIYYGNLYVLLLTYLSIYNPDSIILRDVYPIKGLMKVLDVNEVFVLPNESTVMSCFCFTGLMWASIKFTAQI